MGSATIIATTSSSSPGYHADGWILLGLLVFAVVMIIWGAKEANDKHNRKNGR